MPRNIKHNELNPPSDERMRKSNRYNQLIETIFFAHYTKDAREISFDREELTATAAKLGIPVPKNLGDIIYSFRYRTQFPRKIVSMAKEGLEWIIRPAGRGKYKIVLTKQIKIEPSGTLVETKLLDATPGIYMKYSLDDEQALLAQIRYNRLIDIFTGLTCYSLQNHLRTTTEEFGQVETDEIYVGIDKRGVHYILPVQAKDRNDRIGIVQIEQDLALCKEKFPELIVKPIAAKFMEPTLIALFEFEIENNELRVAHEKHYRLVAPDELSPAELEKYKKRTE